MLATSLSAALRTAQVNQILSASLEEIAEQLAAGDEPLTPDQRQRVVVLVRTTLDVFELEPGARERGTTAVLRTALARLTAFEPELTRMLVRHAAHLQRCPALAVRPRLRTLGTGIVRPACAARATRAARRARRATECARGAT